MDSPSPLVPLKAALRSLLDWLQAEEVKGLVIGGVAASLLGRPRTTRDVDAVIWLDDSDLERFFRAARHHGLEPRIEDALAFARQSRVLLMRHCGSGIDIDIALGQLPFEKSAIQRAVSCRLDELVLPLPRAEDLIVMKAVAHRPRDTADIEALLDAHRGVDRAYVRRLVREFAEALATPDLLSDLEALFRRLPPE